MLKKLLKHEWIATGRKYAMFYLVLVAMTLFVALFSLIEVDSIAGVITGSLCGYVNCSLVLQPWFCCGTFL